MNAPRHEQIEFWIPDDLYDEQLEAEYIRDAVARALILTMEFVCDTMTEHDVRPSAASIFNALSKAQNHAERQAREFLASLRRNQVH